jgi:hypothetical protein
LVKVMVEVDVPPPGGTVVGLFTFVSDVEVVAVNGPAVPIAALGAVTVGPALLAARVALTVYVIFPALPPVDVTAQLMVAGPTPLFEAVPGTAAPVPRWPLPLQLTELMLFQPDGKLSVIGAPVMSAPSLATFTVNVTVVPTATLPVVLALIVGDVTNAASDFRHCEPRVARTARAARRTISRPNFFVPTV